MLNRALIFSASLLALGACSGGKDNPATEPLPTETPVADAASVPEAAVIDEDADLKLVDSLYDDNWTVGYGWSGEYPDGFSIISDGIVLEGREKPDALSPRSLICPLDKNVTIHQWNHGRVETDDLIFVSATRSIPLVVSTDARVEVETTGDEPGVMEIPVKAGDTITLLRYFGEGYGLIRIKGTERVADLQQLNDFTKSDDNIFQEDEWAKVTCDDEAGSRAWLLLADVKQASGIGEAPLEGYGEAGDLVSE